MENRTDKIIGSMNEKLAGIDKQKLRFFRLEELKRNIRRTGEHGKQCAGCRQFLPEAEAVSENIFDAVSVPGNERRELDRLIFRLSNHMMKEHGFFPKYYFSHRFSILGIFAGLAAGYLLVKLFPATGWYLLAAGLIAGLLTGRILGIIKDHRIRNQNKVM